MRSLFTSVAPKYCKTYKTKYHKPFLYSCQAFLFISCVKSVWECILSSLSPRMSFQPSVNSARGLGLTRSSPLCHFIPDTVSGTATSFPDAYLLTSPPLDERQCINPRFVLLHRRTWKSSRVDCSSPSPLAVGRSGEDGLINNTTLLTWGLSAQEIFHKPRGIYLDSLSQGPSSNDTFASLSNTT